jgi:hypothetical protein
MISMALQASSSKTQYRGVFIAPFPTEKKIQSVFKIRIPIANSCARWRCKFKGLSQDGGRADFSKNLRASLFNKDLSNKHNFGGIHLAGLYL